MPRPTLVLLAAGLLAASCGGPPPHLDSTGSTIVCLGDSITAGVGSGGDGAFPARLEAALGVEVLAAGVPGDTSADARARIGEVLAADPWLVIVELGGNDLLARRPIEATEADLAAIVDAVLTAGALPVLVEIRGPFLGGSYGSMFERLGDRFGVPVVEDVLADVLADRALKSDAIHPNGAGHAVIAEALVHLIRPWVEERRRRGLPLAAAGSRAA